MSQFSRAMSNARTPVRADLAPRPALGDAPFHCPPDSKTQTDQEPKPEPKGDQK